MTAPGGTVVYCSCSLQPQEGPERIEPLIGAGGAARREPVKPGEVGGPIGASGARIIVTLLAAMEKYGARKGVASLCIGGGEATAIALERAP